jgi:hypothetical protein
MSKEKKLFCTFCDFFTSKLTMINQNFYCIICRLTLKPTPHDTHKIVAVYSIFQQVMINKLTREYILKNNSIPKPHDIDPNCRLIQYNPTVLHEICNLMTPDERLSFMNIKYFLTDQVSINEIKTVNFFTTIGNRTNGGTNGVNVQSSRIPLLKHQKNLIDKYYQKFIDTNHLNIELLFKSY